MKKSLLSLVLFVGLAVPADALTRKDIPGGLYTDARGDGQYASLIFDSHIETSAGRVELPTFVVDGQTRKDNVLFLRVTPQGAFKIAGQSHAGLGTWEFADGLWKIVGPSFGVNPVIYDWNGVLHLGAPQFGSQGFRYVEFNNTLITGDATVNPFTPMAQALGLTNIWEWSFYMNVAFGQGNTGCIAIDKRAPAEQRYLLSAGDCRFVRVQPLGTLYAVAFTRFTGQGATIFWLTADELSQFPHEGAAPVPVPAPTPTPEPVPAPQPPPLQQCPDTDGIVNGVVRDPQSYVLSLVCKARVADYRTVIRSLEGSFYRFGFGIQTGSDGVPRGRIYLPTAICPNAAPTTPEERFLGVKQDERCWDQLGRFADIVQNDANGNPSVWAYSERGPQPYQPFTGGGTVPDPPPPTGDVDALKKRIAELEAQLAESRALANQFAEMFTKTEAKLVETHDQLIKVTDDLTAANAKLADPCSLVKVDGVRIFGIRLPAGECKPR